MTQPTKSELRKHLRAARKAHVDALPDNMRALMFHRPPAPLLARIPAEAVIGLYHAAPFEAPAAAYARFFRDAGHTIALPHFADRAAPMDFRHHTDPYAQDDLEVGPFGILQPADDADVLMPDVMFVPLVGFTARGERLGQGGGFYDRWLAANPATLAIGMAWDVQEVDSLPLEDHDMPLAAIITPTRILGPF